MRTNCPICAKHQNPENSPLLQGEFWRVESGNIEASVKGYVYLEPIRHVEHWSEFSQEELIEMSELVPKIERAVGRIMPVDRLYIVVISEAVRHLHLHLIPRQQDDQEKGLTLIARATQHRSEIDSHVRREYIEFYDTLRKLLKSEN